MMVVVEGGFVWVGLGVRRGERGERGRGEGEKRGEGKGRGYEGMGIGVAEKDIECLWMRWLTRYMT